MLRWRARRSRMLTILFLLVVLGLLLVPLYIIYKPPAWLIAHFQTKWPDILWRVSTSTKIVALTIDDGPSEFTAEIMEILKENEAAASFFVIGSQVAGREESLVELVRNGNELANHAMHDEPSRKLSDVDLSNQIHAVDEMLQTAYKSAGVRPPQNAGGLAGYRLVLGSIYPHDPQISFPGVNGRHILSMLKPGGIIICHDRRSWTPPMLLSKLVEEASSSV
ncbi:hypothetical protein B0H13DRAFT_1955838 [Mycena leptocephala]|nr:hypothetical protein B0H13DRAFT_1955838 [Mycena leptocephala]